jgi:hypothetical protein
MNDRLKGAVDEVCDECREVDPGFDPDPTPVRPTTPANERGKSGSRL